MAEQVGRITFAPTPIGAVLERPTGELALLWRLYAQALERAEKLAKENKKLKQKYAQIS